MGLMLYELQCSVCLCESVLFSCKCIVTDADLISRLFCRNAVVFDKRRWIVHQSGFDKMQ